MSLDLIAFKWAKFNTYRPEVIATDKNNTLGAPTHPMTPAENGFSKWEGEDKKEKNKQIGYSMNDPLPIYRDGKKGEP